MEMYDSMTFNLKSKLGLSIFGTLGIKIIFLKKKIEIQVFCLSKAFHSQILLLRDVKTTMMRDMGKLGLKTRKLLLVARGSLFRT